MGHTPEHKRLSASERDTWLRWGPYLSERAWGTVREDYDPSKSPWSGFPHDHARSRAYRWNEDGLAGISDIEQNLCFAFAFWNGEDPILKERIYGLTGEEGNHGEDAKETWWYIDATPTASYLEWAYLYPQRAFPYLALIEENRKRSRQELEFELEDTGVLDDRFWDIAVSYSKSDPYQLAITLTVTNNGPDPATLHALPTLWFRNTWSYDSRAARPTIELHGSDLVASCPRLGDVTLTGDDGATPLFCDNETNAARLWGATTSPPFPKDGINDHVVKGTPSVNPENVGSKAALWYRLDVPAHSSTTIRLTLSESRSGTSEPLPLDHVAAVTAARRDDADAFFAEVIPASVDDEARNIARQALAGMVWGKQFYAYDVDRWLDGDSGNEMSRSDGRNHEWRHHFAADVISMPDPWEYPWYAAWDLAFHCIALAHVDPQFAKDQLLLLCRDRYLHPNGQLPAYEWSFSDVNPPVHARAALEVFELDGSNDYEFLAELFNRLLLNFSWWVNRKDVDENNVFGGGFLGLDNIGPFDRSGGIPAGFHLDQADGTAWMANYALDMLQIALHLAEQNPVYEDMAGKFFDHFAHIATAIHEKGLWDDESGFYYDILHGHGEHVKMEVRSMVGLLPLAAAAGVRTQRLLEPSRFADHVLSFVTRRQRFAHNILGARMETDGETILLAVADLERLCRVLAYVTDPAEFLSEYGIRSLSAFHRDQPFSAEIGGRAAGVGYEPGESQSAMFGGNSNWRGPIWFPVNHLLIRSLRRYHAYAGDSFTTEYPAGSGQQHTLGYIADDLASRLINLFRLTDTGQRPALGSAPHHRQERIQFHEYFDGDTGRGLGASHQTGWTGLVADLIIRH